MTQHRLNVFIQPEHAKRLDELAAKKGVSKSSIVAAALASWLSPDAADQREAAIAKRLEHSNWDVRWASVQLLGKLDAQALLSHAQDVAAKLNDADGNVRWAARATWTTAEPIESERERPRSRKCRAGGYLT